MGYPMLLFLLILALVPIVAFWFARRHYPRHVFAISGATLGSVISLVSLGVFALMVIPVIGPLLGKVGLLSNAIHKSTSYSLAMAFGLIPSGPGNTGVSRFYIGVVDAIFWATIYGAAGAIIDLVRSRKHGAE